ncbi:choice-of-anchor J domain-containing protein [Saccharicrinis sp. FJH62]|uniref:choice-of-anchor J domain-containing protein n=1 Tax=Saccharicrinis sp. FJH62 TaxID=3344657 RepID=UPI0035D4BE8C
MKTRTLLTFATILIFSIVNAQENDKPVKLAYVTSDKVMVAQAAQPDDDPIIRMFKADTNFTVTTLVVDDDATVDLSDYDVVVVQEGFNSGASILRPGGSLGLANINVPFLYNKTYALRDGRALDSGGGTSSALAGMSVTVDPENQGNELFNAITFSNNSFDVFYQTANDYGDEGEKTFNYTYGLTISDGSTLLGTAEEIQYPATTAFINDVPAGTTIGSETLNARMIILGMNFGAICYNDGNNLTADGLMLWRNAIYSLAGLEVPTSSIITKPEFQMAGTSDHFEYYSSIPDSLEHVLSIMDAMEKSYANYLSIWERPNSNTIFPEDQKISVYYCAREDNPLFTSSTPEWDCGSNVFASAIIYICEPGSSEQLKYYGDLASVAVNELSQMAIEGLLDRKIDPWYAEGFGLYEMGYRPDRAALLQKLAELGTQEPDVETLYDISNLNEPGNMDLMASFFESKALLGSYFFGHYGDNLYEWWQLLKHYYIKETDRIGIRYSTEHFDYYAAEKELPFLEAMATNMEEQLTLQETRFGQHIDHRINICIYDNEVGLEINNRTNFQGLAEGADKINTSHLEVGHYGLINHEFMHLWVNILCPFSFERIPYPGQFLNEGLAESTDRFMTDEEMLAHRYKIVDLFYHYQRKYNREPTWLEIVDNAEVNEEDGFWVDAYALGEMYWRYMYDKYPENFWIKVKIFLEHDRDWTVFGGKSTEVEGAEFIQFMKELAYVGPPLETTSIPFFEDFKNEFKGWTRMRFGGDDHWQLTDNTGYDDDSCAYAVDPYWLGEEEDKTIDSWLVSPPIDATGSDVLNIQFMFRQTGSASKPELYYTGNFSGPIVKTDWTVIENLNWNIPEWTWDKIEFEIENPPEKLFIAIRFHSVDGETYSYLVDNFNVTQQVAASVPQVTTLNATEISSAQGTINGNIVSDGGSGITQRGFYWSSTNENPSASDNVEIVNGTTGAYSYELTDLTPETDYYFRAFATNSEGTAAGLVKQFKTIENLTVPEVVTLSASSNSENAVSLNGNVSSDGGTTITQRGFYWSLTNTSPNDGDNKEVITGTTGEFTYTLTNLVPNTTYYYRAFADNSEGTALGEILQFKTDEVLSLFNLPFYDDFSAEYKNWTILSREGNDNWHISGDDGIDGGKCARAYTINSDDAEDNWLISPFFNTQDMSRVDVQFKYWYYGDELIPRFYYSTTCSEIFNEADWTEITGLPEITKWVWEDINISLNELQESLVFAFQYNCNKGEDNKIMIDNFSIESVHTGNTMTYSADNDVKIYPNPVAHELKIKLQNNYGVIKIYNVPGKNILLQSITNSENTIDVSTFEDGIYIIEVIQNNKVLRSKFVKD